MTDPIRVLLIDDDEDEFILTRDLLSQSVKSRFHLDWTPDYDVAREDMANDHHDVYLLDYRLGPRDGLELLRSALKAGCSAPVLMLTGQGDGEVDFAAMHGGAADYLVKGRLSGELLERALRYAVERKRIEKQMARQRDEFVAMLTHDMKNPLQVILGAADMLLEASKKAANENDATLLRNILGSALTINSLVSNYLDFAKMEAGGIVLSKRSLALDEILSKLCQRYESGARRHSQSLELRCAEKLPRVYGDPLALERIFANLLSNALKFTPEGGCVSVSAQSTGAEIAVAVIDNGPGIVPDEIPKIFAKYQRARGSGGKDGVGLGLFIVKSLVEAHGGRVDVQSRPGLETRFSVVLPAGSCA